VPNAEAAPALKTGYLIDKGRGECHDPCVLCELGHNHTPFVC
jgi:hypothetical protein